MAHVHVSTLVGDYVEVGVKQTSGASYDINYVANESPIFWVPWQAGWSKHGHRHFPGEGGW